MSESIQRRFTALPIKKAFVVDLSFDAGEEFSLKLFPDPAHFKLGGVYEKYALRFSCTLDVQFSLQANDAPIQIIACAAKDAKDRKSESSGNPKEHSRKRMLFILRLSTGQLEVEAEDFSLTVIQRLEIANQYIDHE
jgi:hypothetical protein